MDAGYGANTRLREEIGRTARGRLGGLLIRPAGRRVRDRLDPETYGGAYLLGLRAKKPRLSAHGYVEKAEYWAVVWGTLVMVATGLLGVFTTVVDFFMAWLVRSVV